MSQQQWTAVDEYFSEVLIGPDEALESALAAADAAGLPHINVAPNQGKLLQLLARTQGARRILEVGTLGGYSAIWLARALPAGGRLITLEIDPAHAAVATANLAHAGLADSVEVRVGPAADSLRQLAEDGAEPFDLVFIDADKPSNPLYFEWAVKLTRPGSLIVVDNVVRGGAVGDADSTDPSVVAVRRMHDLIAAEPRVTATSVQTVGTKGYDGFTLIRVEG
ncbi:O-methyltransferase [Kitasatospora paracochleata]|uniref:O-methyltransferase YrrM n=1 Tax=Kitasatospora paracochleata TaxID=58354 RepID=A0ABT1J7Z1_9ACTN|nr:O-methyltransferase [Kitasatospora paracochleata]MCP2313550.1 putative O-methyltransferase YrrM [Kitasatospora paracochleata]